MGKPAIYTVSLPEGFDETGEAADFATDMLAKVLEASKGGLKWHEMMGLMTHVAVKGVGAVQGSDEIGAELKAAFGGKMSKLLKLGAWVLADAAADLEDEGM